MLSPLHVEVLTHFSTVPMACALVHAYPYAGTKASVRGPSCILAEARYAVANTCNATHDRSYDSTVERRQIWHCSAEVSPNA